jgi:hypothetical protein
MSTQQIGGWCVTFTGRHFCPLAPRVEDISIGDIAHSLSNLCRFGGHSLKFYSVAQHCLLVARLVPAPLALTGLLHDATKCYLGEMVRPLKQSMPDYRRAHDDLWAVIARRFNLPRVLPPEIKQADDVALVTERRDLLIRTPDPWDVDEAGCLPDPQITVPLPPEEARRQFLEKYRVLTQL